MSVRYLVFFACVAACILGHLAILVAVARRPARASEPGMPRPRRALEIFWAIVPAVVLALVVTATWDRVRDPAPSPPAVMKVAR